MIVHHRQISSPLFLRWLFRVLHGGTTRAGEWNAIMRGSIGWRGVQERGDRAILGESRRSSHHMAFTRLTREGPVAVPFRLGRCPGHPG